MSNVLVRRALLIASVFCLLASSSLGATFLNGNSYPVGNSPHAVASGDFNNDGVLDLVVANSGQSSVDVLLGNGDGSFGTAVQYKAGGLSPNCLAVGDFNRDGNLDVAIGSNTVVSILLGNGDGTFQLPLLADNGGTQFIATADFNNDGILDLVYEDGEIELQLGNGDGTFQPPQTFFLTAAYFSLAVSDFNGDGNLDVAAVLTGNPGYVAVLIGTGTGSFLPGPAKYTVGPYPQSVTVADLNGDGKLDLAVADAQSSNSDSHGSVSVLLGQGDGTFRLFHNYPSATDYTSRTIATGDFNKDGTTDLVVVNDATNNVTELLNNGDGTFEQLHWSVGNQPEFMVVADLNRDGIPDLVTANSGSDDVTVLLGEAGGVFNGARDISVGNVALLQTFPLFGATGDFNEDGKPDLVVTNPGTVEILLGRGHGAFAPPVTYTTSKSTLNPDVAVADLNGDSHVDIVEVNQSTGNDTISVLLGNGDGTFGKAANYGVGVRSASVAIADFNGDGIPDLAVANAGYPQAGNISLLFGNGDGTFQPAINFSDGFQSPWWVIAADVNGDGKQDLLDISLGGLAVSLGNGDGTFQTPIVSLVGQLAMFGVVADLNGDGKLDLVVADGRTGDVNVSLGNGDGTFQTRTDYFLGEVPVAVAVADFNGDSVPDIAVANTASSFSILRGKGDGTFTVTHGGKVGSNPSSIVAADFDGDGNFDLGIFNVGSNEVTILRNTTH